MPANTNPIFIADRKAWALELDNGDGTTAAVLVSAGSNGSLIETIAVTSTDTAAVELDLYINNGTSDFAVGSATIPIGAGTDGGTTAAVDLLQQTDLPWVRDDLTLALEAGHSLKIGAHAAITATYAVHVVAFGGDY